MWREGHDFCGVLRRLGTGWLHQNRLTLHLGLRRDYGFATLVGLRGDVLVPRVAPPPSMLWYEAAPGSGGAGRRFLVIRAETGRLDLRALSAFTVADRVRRESPEYAPQ